MSVLASSTVVRVLAVAGGILELGGLLMVAWSLFDLAEAAIRLASKSAMASPETVATTSSVGSAVDAHLTGGEQRTTEERVAALRQESAEADAALQKRLEDRIAHFAAKERDARRQIEEALTVLLSTGKQRVGWGLFVAGLGSSVAANWL